MMWAFAKAVAPVMFVAVVAIYGIWVAVTAALRGDAIVFSLGVVVCAMGQVLLRMLVDASRERTQ